MASNDEMQAKMTGTDSSTEANTSLKYDKRQLFHSMVVGAVAALVTSVCICMLIFFNIDKILDVILSSNAGDYKNPTEASVNESDSNVALKLAEENKDNVELSTMYYANAITRNPDNVEAIRKYTDLIYNKAADMEDEEAIASYSMLAAFLGNIIPEVSSKNVAVVNDIISDVNRHIAEINEKIQNADGVSEETEETSNDENKSRVLSELASLNDLDLDTLSTLEENIQKIETVLASNIQYIETDKDEDSEEIKAEFEKIRERLAKAQMNLAFHNSVLELEGLINSINDVAGDDRMKRDTMVLGIINYWGTLLLQLNKVSDNCRSAYNALDEKIKELNSLDIETVNNSEKEVLDNTAEEVINDIEYVQNCQSEIRKVEELIEKLSSARISESDRIDKTKKYQELLKKLHEKQRDKYNAWADNVIKDTYERMETVEKDGKKWPFGIGGLKDDAKDRIVYMLRDLGRVDTQYLDYRTADNYRRVYEHGKSLLDEDRILKEIEDVIKRPIEDF